MTPEQIMGFLLQNKDIIYPMGKEAIRGAIKTMVDTDPNMTDEDALKLEGMLHIVLDNILNPAG